MLNSILVINTGSSNVKFSVFENNDAEGLRCVKEGKVEGTDPFAAVATIGECIKREFPNAVWTAIGHRVVHGGQKFVEPLLLDDQNLAELRGLIPLDPLHQPISLAAIEACQRIFSGVPQIACFDTAFHLTQPEVATAIPLPRYLTEQGIRRYGFHGISYQFVASAVRAIDPNLAAGRMIIAHLGNGASLCALRDGKSVATTMGFSVLDGLMMGTRCGSIDPGVLLYLLNSLGITPQELEDILYRKSGLLGVSGISNDVRTLLASTDSNARQALDLYVYRIVREIGSLVASLGGLDGIVFTGGVGEHSSEIRHLVIAQLSWLGFEIDKICNEGHATRISAPDSMLPAYVIHTDENRMIALQIASMPT